METEDGTRYRVTHVRERIGASLGEPPVVLPKGGRTIVEIVEGDGDEAVVVASAVAVCSPRDNYNRRLGRTIALGRALKAHRA